MFRFGNCVRSSLNKLISKQNKMIVALRFSSVKSDTLKNLENPDTFGIGSRLIELDSNRSRKTMQAKESDADDSDTFGTISNRMDNIKFKGFDSNPIPNSSYVDEDEKDNIDKAHDVEDSDDTANITESETSCIKNMTKLAESGHIDKAIDVFYNQLIGKHGNKPSLWAYKELICVCTKAGRYNDAFKAFDELHKSEVFKPSSTKTHRILTVLFKACCFIKDRNKALDKLDLLKAILKTKSIVPNEKTYASMINAYGRLGCLSESKSILNEMKKNKVKPTANTFSNLLCGCVGERTGGYKEALQVWKKMLSSNIRPSLIEYNLLVRCIRDCTFKVKNNSPKYVGKFCFTLPDESDEVVVTMDAQSSVQTIQIDEPNTNDADSSTVHLQPDEVHVINELEIIGKKVSELEWWQKANENLTRADTKEPLRIHDSLIEKKMVSLLIDKNSNLDKLELKNETPFERLKMIGNLDGLFKSMKRHKVEPDTRTFSLLIQCLPNDTEHEVELIKYMDSFKTPMELFFCNILLKRRITRNETKLVEETLRTMQLKKLCPNVYTFEVLAYSIDNKNKLDTFLNDLKQFNYELNDNMVRALVKTSHSMKNASLMCFLIRLFQEKNIKLDQLVIKDLRNMIEKTKKIIIDYEKTHNTYTTLDEKEDVFYKQTNNYYNHVKPIFDKWLQSMQPSNMQNKY